MLASDRRGIEEDVVESTEVRELWPLSLWTQDWGGRFILFSMEAPVMRVLRAPKPGQVASCSGKLLRASSGSILSSVAVVAHSVTVFSLPLS